MSLWRRREQWEFRTRAAPTSAHGRSRHPAIARKSAACRFRPPLCHVRRAPSPLGHSCIVGCVFGFASFGVWGVGVYQFRKGRRQQAPTGDRRRLRERRRRRLRRAPGRTAAHTNNTYLREPRIVRRCSRRRTSAMLTPRELWQEHRTPAEHAPVCVNENGGWEMMTMMHHRASQRIRWQVRSTCAGGGGGCLGCVSA